MLQDTTIFISIYIAFHGETQGDGSAVLCILCLSKWAVITRKKPSPVGEGGEERAG